MSGWWGDDGLHRPVIAGAMAAGASQDGWELGMALIAVADLSPAVVVEIGCDRGGSLYAWRSVAERVLGITTADNSYETGGSGEPLEPHGAEVLFDDSHYSRSLDWLIVALDDAPVDALVIDGDHTEAGVRADLADYGPLVRPGGLILLHDIGTVGDPRAEVHKVWPALAATYETTEIRNPEGGFGWGLIHVRPGDRFEEARCG